MNSAESVKWIADKESPELLEAFEFNGINWWILARYHTLLHFKSPEQYRRAISVSEPKMPFWKKSFNLWKIKRKLFKNIRTKKAETFFLSSLSYYSDNMEGKRYNRHIDPVIDSILKEKSISWFKLEGDDNQELQDADFFHQSEFYSSRLIQEFNWWQNTKRKLAEYEDWISVLDARYGLKLNINMFIWHMTLIQDHAFLFEKILSHVKPKLIFTVCYYSPPCLGLILAARKSGIKVCDIQHGKQGTFHHMYSHFNQLPAFKKRLMPDLFWCWGLPSSDSINRFMSEIRDDEIPKAFPIGNLWLQKWKNFQFKDSTTAEKEFFGKFSAILLFAGQPVETEKSVAYLKGLLEGNKQLLVLYRFHPVQDKDRIFIEDELSRFENVDFKYANSTPLYELILKADAVITLWSSVAVEALEFGKKVIIMHLNGGEIYREFIQKGDFYFDEDPEKITDILAKDNPIEKSGFIISDSLYSLNMFDEMTKHILN